MSLDQITFDLSKTVDRGDSALSAAWTIGSSRPARMVALFETLAERMVPNQFGGYDLFDPGIAYVRLDENQLQFCHSAHEFWHLVDDVAQPIWVHPDVKPSFWTDGNQLTRRSPVVDGQHQFETYRYLSQNCRDEIFQNLRDVYATTGPLSFEEFVILLRDSMLPAVLSKITYRYRWLRAVQAVVKPLSPRDQILNFLLRTGCPPPSTGAARANRSAAAIPVHDGGYSDTPHFRPSGFTSAKTWSHCRPVPRRREADRAQGRSTNRRLQLVRSAFYVRRSGATQQRDLENRNRPALVAAF